MENRTDILLFFLFSLPEYVAIFSLMFTMFRMPIAPKDKILFVGLMLCLVSYFFRYSLNIPSIAVVLQIIVFVIFIVFLWRFNWFYSFIMVNIAYSLYVLIQAFWTLIFEFSHTLEYIERLQDSFGFAFISYFFQVLSVLTTYLVCFVIKRYHGGWSFISDDSFPVNFKNSNNASLLVITAISTVISVVVSFVTNEIIFFQVFFLLVVTSIVLFYLSKRKEWEHDSFDS